MLAERLAARHPNMRVLYMSGYTNDAIAQHGIIAPGIELLEKPLHTRVAHPQSARGVGPAGTGRGGGVMTARGPWLCLALLFAGAAPARAQDWLVLNGIADGEAWSTDSVSPLLSRNEGEFATLGSFYLLAGVAPHPKVQLIFMGELEGGDATDESDQWEFEYQQLMLRLMPSPLATFDIGKRRRHEPERQLLIVDLQLIGFVGRAASLDFAHENQCTLGCGATPTAR